ncbi:N-acetyltransferase [Angustibacter aerolatus]|uniref:N-acetyltransferase n=1 Tax=Angustibacter aerolatus TaxID=1162965 RepID=A0ABQ6JEU1_9ACTN|nr:hypothetical protein [Angustibacter aerolatus]GMA86708.1 N-acetyltransferase [Angustibacter aerolatus]
MTVERSLEEITPENIGDALGIEVRDDQRRAVAPVAKSLAEAYAFRERAWPRVIRCEGRAVGFLMAFFDFDFNHALATSEPDLRSGLWRLSIAAAHQRRGHGRYAVAAVAAEAPPPWHSSSHDDLARRRWQPRALLPGAGLLTHWGNERR